MKLFKRLLAFVANWFRRSRPIEPPSPPSPLSPPALLALPTIRCDFTHCVKPAYCKIRWGKANQQYAKVCKWHCEAIWVQVQPQIKMGVCFWIQEPIC